MCERFYGPAIYDQQLHVWETRGDVREGENCSAGGGLNSPLNPHVCFESTTAETETQLMWSEGGGRSRLYLGEEKKKQTLLWFPLGSEIHLKIGNF